jgi:putative heme-binding domain-containing protein
LYIVDMARETIEHPKSLPEPIKSQLDLTSGRNLGRIWRIVYRDSPIRRDPPGLDRADTATLVETLSHPNGWHRETASQLLVLKQDATWIPELRAMVISYASPLARLHAMSVLATMPHGIDAETWLKTVQDPHPKIRLWSLILLPRFADHLSTSDLLKGFLALRNERDLEIRMVAAVRSRTVFGVRTDRSERADRESIADVLLAWAGSDAGSDDWKCDELRAAVEYAIAGGNIEGFADRMMPILSAQATADSVDSWWDAILFQLHQSKRLHTWMGRFSESEKSPQTIERLMAGLSRLVNRRQITDPEARTAVQQFARDHALEWVKQSIASAKPSQSVALDRIAIQLLTILPAEELSTLLTAILDLENKTDLQQAAVDAWLANDHALQVVVMDRWEHLSPPVLNSLFQGSVRSIGGTRLLLDRIDSGRMDPKRVPAWAWQAIRGSTDERIRKRAAQWDGLSTSRWEEIRETYSQAWMQAGAAEQGETQFRKWCASCHRVNGIGIQLGPSLDSYRVRTNEAIAIAIAEPSRDMDPKYEQHQIRTTDDETYAGLLSASGTDYIEITSAQNQVSRIAKGSIETWTTTGKSFMPDGLLQELGPTALNDLIAFLRSAP